MDFSALLLFHIEMSCEIYRWTMACVTMSYFVVLINGPRYPFLIKHRHSLSHYLFLLLIEGLNRGFLEAGIH